MDHPAPALANPRGWRSWLSLPSDPCGHPLVVIGLMIVAWGFTVWVRMTWVSWAGGEPGLLWQDTIQPTTHDAYTHGAVLQKHYEGLHENNPHLFPLFNGQGALHVLSWVFLKVFGTSIATLLVWAPVLVTGLIVVPYILMGRLLGATIWGFGTALLAGVCWNFYERTMAGYFDTDIFSFGMIVLVLYLLMAAHQKRSLPAACLASLVIFIYPFFYAKGLVVGASLAICFLGLQLILVWARREADVRLRMIAVVAVGIAVSQWSRGGTLGASPWLWFIGLSLVLAVTVLAVRLPARDPIAEGPGRKVTLLAAACLLGIVLVLPWGYFIGQVATYSQFFPVSEDVSALTDPTAIQESAIRQEINFRKVHKYTVLESQSTPFEDTLQRIIGSVTGGILAGIGLTLMCIRYPAFLIGLPLMVMGLFAFDGGLRFTTWGGLIAAPALVYLLFILAQAGLRVIVNRDGPWVRLGTIVTGLLLTAPFLAVNVAHAISFKVGSPFMRNAIESLDAIRRDSTSGDYVMTWWDYGSGVWYYANRNVLMTPISASDDCWTIAKILNMDSQREAAQLARAATLASMDGARPAIHGLLGLGESEQALRTPDELLESLAEGPDQRRSTDPSVYLYVPIGQREMLDLASVVAAYARADGTLPGRPGSGVCHSFMGSDTRQVGDNQWMLPNGFGLDLSDVRNPRAFVPVKTDQGYIQRPVAFRSISLVRDIADMRAAVFTGQQDPTADRVYVKDGTFAYELKGPQETAPDDHLWVHLIVLEGSGRIMVMDDEFFNSNLIQMAVLQNLDPEYWTLLHKNASARVFKMTRPGADVE